MERKINISFYDATKKAFAFQSLRVFYEFAIQERDFWKPHYERLKNPAGLVKTYTTRNVIFQKIIDTIDGWKDQLNSWDEGQLSQQINNLIGQHLQHEQHYLWSGHTLVEPLIDCHNKYGQNASDAFANLVIRGAYPGQINNTELFFGVMLGYEFLHQESDIVKRRNGEKVSLGHLRSQLAEAKDKLFTEVEEFKSDYSQWDQYARETNEKLHRVNKKLGNRQIKHQNKLFDENLRIWSQSIDELEKTFKEKLRLDGPAEYWHKAAKRFSIQGGLWSLALIALVVVGLLYFREFFLTWLRGQELGIKLHTVQGIILFGSIAAVYAYLIKVLSRLAFSAFHLMRDAEEREQLTHLYLALSKETEVDEKSREIVLQALFSRSETGLLAQEHGPTMPGASELLRSVLRSKGQ